MTQLTDITKGDFDAAPAIRAIAVEMIALILRLKELERQLAELRTKQQPPEQRPD